MTTQKFMCYPGDENSTPVEIDIPTHCPICDIEIVVAPFLNGGVSFFVIMNWKQCCSNIFSNHLSIWAKYGVQTQPIQIGYPDGVVCKKCNGRNPWGEPNRPDGTYLCYECK